MLKTRRQPRTFEKLLAAYPTDVQTLARQARGFVLELLPDVAESVDGSAPVIGFGPATSGSQASRRWSARPSARSGSDPRRA